jgi:hypothetical protein
MYVARKIADTAGAPPAEPASVATTAGGGWAATGGYFAGVRRSDRRPFVFATAFALYRYRYNTANSREESTTRRLFQSDPIQSKQPGHIGGGVPTESHAEIVKSVRETLSSYDDPTVMFQLQKELAIKEERFEDARWVLMFRGWGGGGGGRQQRPSAAAAAAAAAAAVGCVGS